MKATMSMMRPAAVLAALALLGCGGGGDDAGRRVLASGNATAQAGDARTGAPLLVLVLPGPLVHMPQPGAVRVRLRGTLELGAHYAAAATLDVALSAPATLPTRQAMALRPGAPNELTFDYSVELLLPAGDSVLLATLVAAATLDGLPSGALSRAVASAEWLVSDEP